MNLLQFKNFSAYYKLKRKQYAVALDNVTFDVREGEFLVVVGPSGCGKTTLLKCILGLITLNDGDLLIDGIPADKVNKKELAVSYVSQDYSLYPKMTVYDNIAFPLRMMRTPYTEVNSRVKNIAELLEIDWLLSRKPNQLSGGQHQRVAIARALIKQPRIMLFDEPFANLDPALRLELRTLLKDLHSKQKPTIVFVTHDLSEAFMLADRIVVINRGEIVEAGTPQEIESNPKTQFTKEFFGK